MDKCRLCYTDPKPQECQHIFNTKFEPPIWKIIEQLSDLIITKNDPYTKNICGPCFNKLEEYSAFRRTILDTNFDYFEVHCPPTSSHCDAVMIKEEKIEIEEDPLEIGHEIKEELNISSIADYQYNQSSDGNEISNVKDIVDSSNIFDNNAKKEEFNVQMSSNNTKKYNTRSSQRLNVDNFIYIKEETTNENSESSKSCQNTRYGLNMNLLENYAEIQTHDEKPLKSNTCNKDNSDETDLCRPKQVHTVKKTYRCNICKKQFSHKTSLSKHQRVHTGEKPFKCTICDKQFAQKATLWTHQRVHTGEKPFQCNICKKQFSRKMHLLCHKHVHTGEKPFKCNICNKQFSRKSILRTHQRLHTGERPFKCNICKQQFSQRTHLLGHQRVHTDEKPFKCNICDKSFKTRSSLKQHLNIHTGQKPYCCNICNETFTFRSARNIHLKSHKNGGLQV